MTVASQQYDYGGDNIDYLVRLVNIPIYIYLISIVLWFFIWRWKKEWKTGLFVGYLFLILAETVLLRRPGDFRYELAPFWSWDEVLGKYPLTARGNMLLHQILLNIIMFVPIGILISQRMGWKSIPLASCISFFIELMQLLTRRGLFELDDIIHNTIGTLLGYVFYEIKEFYKQSTKEPRKKQTEY